ncbi:hypothetical protein H5300_22640 [Vibrio sp. SG41-7]|nr:hypothetical protein [Vibrio sp. SG41-7]
MKNLSNDVTFASKEAANSFGCGSFESTRYILAIQPLFSLLFMEIPVIL